MVTMSAMTAKIRTIVTGIVRVLTHSAPRNQTRNQSEIPEIYFLFQKLAGYSAWFAVGVGVETADFTEEMRGKWWGG